MVEGLENIHPNLLYKTQIATPLHIEQNKRKQKYEFVPSKINCDIREKIYEFVPSKNI